MNYETGTFFTQTKLIGIKVIDEIETVFDSLDEQSRFINNMKSISDDETRSETLREWIVRIRDDTSRV